MKKKNKHLPKQRKKKKIPYLCDLLIGNLCGAPLFQQLKKQVQPSLYLNELVAQKYYVEPLSKY